MCAHFGSPPSFLRYSSIMAATVILTRWICHERQTLFDCRGHTVNVMNIRQLTEELWSGNLTAISLFFIYNRSTHTHTELKHIYCHLGIIRHVS